MFIIIVNMRSSAQKFVAVAAILSLIPYYIFISVLIVTDTEDQSSSYFETPIIVATEGEGEIAKTLKRLDDTEDIWFRQRPEQHDALKAMHEDRKLHALHARQLQTMERLSICDRETKIGTTKDLSLLHRFKNQNGGTCPEIKSKRLLLLSSSNAYGRTGNNIMEFINALQYARDNGITLGLTIVSDHGSAASWVFKLITEMWMSLPDDTHNLSAKSFLEGRRRWKAQFEEAFCVKIFNRVDDVKGSGYRLIKPPSSKKLLKYLSTSSLEDNIGEQSHYYQTLFRNYNNGKGRHIRGHPSQDMCSGLNAVFGPNHRHTIYSVIHQRALEGEPGLRLMRGVSNRTGCDPTGALNMEPDYIKSILAPLGMLQYPIVMISDGQDPSVLERLQADPDISNMLRVIPEENSWIGGDITLAVMSNVFIGNPSSTFSLVIAKSRLALGFGHNHLYRAQDPNNGRWHTVCGDTCVYPGTSLCLSCPLVLPNPVARVNVL